MWGTFRKCERRATAAASSRRTQRPAAARVRGRRCNFQSFGADGGREGIANTGSQVSPETSRSASMDGAAAGGDSVGVEKSAGKEERGIEARLRDKPSLI